METSSMDKSLLYKIILYSNEFIYTIWRSIQLTGDAKLYKEQKERERGEMQFTDKTNKQCNIIIVVPPTHHQHLLLLSFSLFIKLVSLQTFQILPTCPHAHTFIMLDFPDNICSSISEYQSTIRPLRVSNVLLQIWRCWFQHQHRQSDNTRSLLHYMVFRS